MVKLYFRDCPKELGVSYFDICARMAQLSRYQMPTPAAGPALPNVPLPSDCKGTDRPHPHQDRELI